MIITTNNSLGLPRSRKCQYEPENWVRLKVPQPLIEVVWFKLSTEQRSIEFGQVERRRALLASNPPRITPLPTPTLQLASHWGRPVYSLRQRSCALRRKRGVSASDAGITVKHINSSPNQIATAFLEVASLT